jgi:hypothetical protein
LKEVCRGFEGTSTKILEEGRAAAFTKEIPCEYAQCYRLAKDILTRMQVYFYAEDTKKGMLAFYVSQEDTTPVGVFVVSLDQDRTRIEVSSPSTAAKETVSKKLFYDVDVTLSLQKGETHDNTRMQDK